MPKVIYIDDGGSREEVELKNNTSVMEGAVRNGIDGIVAECGGCCSCATCHVYVDEAWVGKTGVPSSLEDEMLECTESERRANSRLSCQLKVSDELDGLIVHTPPAQ